MKATVLVTERTNGMQVINITFDGGQVFDIRAKTDGTLEVNGGFAGALVVKPYMSNEIIIVHESTLVH